MKIEHRSYCDFFFLTCSKGWDPGRWRYSCCWKFPHSSRPSDTSLQSYVAWRTCAGPQSWPMDGWTAGACQSTLWLCWLRILWGAPAWEKQQQNCHVNNRLTDKQVQWKDNLVYISILNKKINRKRQTKITLDTLIVALLCQDSSSTSTGWMSILGTKQISGLTVHVHLTVLTLWSSSHHLKSVTYDKKNKSRQGCWGTGQRCDYVATHSYHFELWD